MSYIINPWWFYLINIISKFNLLLNCIFVISVLVSFGTALVYFCGDMLEDTSKRMARFLKISLIFSLVAASLIVFIPDESTMNKMLVANTLTKQNISAGAEFTQDQIGEIIDKIADAAIKVKQAENGDKT
ncbi:hypothetical protein ACE418_03060 [Megasphaera sp. WILCCON 0056]|uniref:hypothetical protein n=1 Tax=Megasphaera sp. WILCCON 0056 TaxID=3345340 RepID=UPI003A802E65